MGCFIYSSEICEISHQTGGALGGFIRGGASSRVQALTHSHLQSFATPPPRVAVRRREVIRHADGRGWEKMENVEFRNFPSMTSRKSYCISKIMIFETVSRWLTCDYSPRNNTMSHLLPAVIWWPSSRCICRCLLIGGKLNSIKFLWRYLKSWIKANDT